MQRILFEQADDGARWTEMRTLQYFILWQKSSVLVCMIINIIEH